MLGVRNQRLIVNGVLRDAGHDQIAAAFCRPSGCSVGERSRGAVGVGCRCGGAGHRRRHRARCPAPAPGAQAGPAALEHDAADIALPGLHDLVDALDAAGNGVVMTMGKGGSQDDACCCARARAR